ncbi:hypothetical protein [Streptomyces sp. NRRL B-1140]|uniref:hypothetical protein n=1 Tax=Streptomyces sp. NRRL B-1140 TaxID=1415549 RepID=UPI000B0B6A47|nr:hypothetical protein [Streptomyces sp. NRRL B-1140]
MSDASTNQMNDADVQQPSSGPGRHRGEVSTQDGETAPRGRHRKPVTETGQAVTAA